jgi:hypothetical protein
MGSSRDSVFVSFMRWGMIFGVNVFIRENNLFCAEARIVQQAGKVAL